MVTHSTVPENKYAHQAKKAIEAHDKPLREISLKVCPLTKYFPSPCLFRLQIFQLIFLG